MNLQIALKSVTAPLATRLRQLDSTWLHQSLSSFVLVFTLCSASPCFTTSLSNVTSCITYIHPSMHPLIHASFHSSIHEPTHPPILVPMHPFILSSSFSLSSLSFHPPSLPFFLLSFLHWKTICYGFPACQASRVGAQNGVRGLGRVRGWPGYWPREERVQSSPPPPPRPQVSCLQLKAKNHAELQDGSSFSKLGLLVIP